MVADNSTVVGGSCEVYPASISIDKKWKAARGFNLIAIILGGSVIMLDVLQGCMSTKKNEPFRLGSFLHGVCCVCSLFSLLLLDSDLCKDNTLIELLNESNKMIHFHETCSISQGGKSTIAAGVLWFAAAVGTVLLHPSNKMQHQNTVDDGLDEPLFDENNNIL